MNSKTEPVRKEEMYVTAKALVSCAHFKAGDFVSVKFSHWGDNGKAWYLIDKSQHGPLPCTVAYHSGQLTQFCL